MTLLAGTTPGGFFARIETVPAQLEAEPFPYRETESTLRRLNMLGYEAPRGDKADQALHPEFRGRHTTITAEKEAELLVQAFELLEESAT